MEQEKKDSGASLRDRAGPASPRAASHLGHAGTIPSAWLDIRTAPLEQRIVMAYFGPNPAFDTAAAVGHLFQWEGMKAPLPTGWAFRVEPTHWMPLPGITQAQAIEARSGQTREGLDPKGESAVGNADAPEPKEWR